MSQSDASDQQLSLDDLDLYLPPRQRFARKWLIVAVLTGVLVLCLVAGGLVLALGAGAWLFGPPAEAQILPPHTPVRPTLPTATALPVAGLSVWCQTNPTAPVGLVEIALSLPAAAQVSFEPPPGLRYWRGDLLQAGSGLAYNTAGPQELRWFLFREPGAAFPMSLTVELDGRATTVTLRPDTSTTTSIPLD